MIEISTRARVTPAVSHLCRTLGVTVRPAEVQDRGSPVARTLAEILRRRPGLVVAVCGPSGGGKSSLLRALARRLRRPIARTPESAREACIDAVRAPLRRAAAALARAGLAEAAALLRTPRELSDGQRHRLAIAAALSRGRGPLLLDEFASVLDRPTAASLCLSVARWARRSRRSIVCATAHDDAVGWLDPDIIVRAPLGAAPEITRRGRRDAGG